METIIAFLSFMALIGAWIFAPTAPRGHNVTVDLPVAKATA